VVDSSYSDTWKYMPLLFLGTAFSAFSAFYGSIYLKNKRTFKLFTTTIVGGLINVVITYFLIPSVGLFAPGIGTLVGCIYFASSRSEKDFRFEYQLD
jgi:O-antigen/teichoic acid export membrane protein